MADTIIVAVFSTAKAAYDAAHAIKAIKQGRDNRFKLKSGIIVAKDDKGVVSVLESDNHPFHGMKVGAVVGGLIGLIAGAPIAALGALLGATLGVINDSGMAIVKSFDATSVKDAMGPGTTAVIIEAHEANPEAIDEIVAKGGGRVFRKAAP